MDIKELELTEEEADNARFQAGCGKGYLPNSEFTVSEIIRQVEKSLINKVLSHPRFCWKAENQELPEGVGFCMDCTDSYKMLEAGFVKIESKEEVKG
uniref:Uncharacterized protein n=1 Tax=viral metagenome TaxID=1070528 RepID=A0A6M3LM88_9ZZZZ